MSSNPYSYDIYLCAILKKKKISFFHSVQYMLDKDRVDNIVSGQYYQRFQQSLHKILDSRKPSAHPSGGEKNTLIRILIQYLYILMKDVMSVAKPCD